MFAVLLDQIFIDSERQGGFAELAGVSRGTAVVWSSSCVSPGGMPPQLSGSLGLIAPPGLCSNPPWAPCPPNPYTEPHTAPLSMTVSGLPRFMGCRGGVGGCRGGGGGPHTLPGEQ